MVLGGKQSEYDKELRDSELVFFLFFKKVGDYTKHEFKVAFESFKQIRKPKIVTYIKYVDSADDVNEEVKRFMDILDGELNHYYNTYGNIDTLKLGILMQIKIMKLDSSVIEINNGIVTLNGKEIADSTKIPMFEGNGISQMRKELSEILTLYYDLRGKYVSDPDDMEIYKQYSKIASKKAWLEENIRNAEKRILKIAEQMAEETASGKLSAKQREGYRLFEKGDYDGALDVLNFEDILTEVCHNEQLAKNIGERLQINVNELKQRIEVLKAKGINSRTADEIRKIYDKVYDLTTKHNLDKDVLYDYASFLYDQNDYKNAVRVAEQLLYYYGNPEEKVSDEQYGRLYNMLGNLYRDTQRINEAETNFKNAKEIYVRLCEKNPDAYEPDLAGSYNNIGTLHYSMNIGILHYSMQHINKAEIAFKKAIEIRKRLCKKNSNAYEPELATSYNNIGALYYKMQRMSEAETNFENAIEICERLCKNNPDAYELGLADSYNNMGALYSNTQRMDKAETNFKKAIKIYEQLCEKNPDAYEPDLAVSYYNIGILYSDIRRMSEAEIAFKKAIKIRERLCEKNSDTFESVLAMSYYNIGVCYYETNSSEAALIYIKKALEIYERLYKRHPSIYKANLEAAEKSLEIIRTQSSM